MGGGLVSKALLQNLSFSRLSKTHLVSLMAEHPSEGSTTVNNDSDDTMHVDNDNNEGVDADMLSEASDDTHADDLLDEIPQAQVNVADKVVAVLDLMDHLVLDLDELMHAIFYDESLPMLRNNSRVKTARQIFRSSDRFDKILRNLGDPPRKTSKGRKSLSSEAAQRRLDIFAFETVSEILSKELSEFAAAARTSNFESEAPEITTIDNSLSTCLLATAEYHTPWLLNLLGTISDKSGGSDAGQGVRSGAHSFNLTTSTHICAQNYSRLSCLQYASSPLGRTIKRTGFRSILRRFSKPNQLRVKSQLCSIDLASQCPTPGLQTLSLISAKAN